MPVEILGPGFPFFTVFLEFVPFFWHFFRAKTVCNDVMLKKLCVSARALCQEILLAQFQPIWPAQVNF